jgi:hypothetical protein
MIDYVAEEKGLQRLARNFVPLTFPGRLMMSNALICFATATEIV